MVVLLAEMGQTVNLRSVLTGASLGQRTSVKRRHKSLALLLVVVAMHLLAGTAAAQVVTSIVKDVTLAWLTFQHPQVIDTQLHWGAEKFEWMSVIPPSPLLCLHPPLLISLPNLSALQT